jgi:hypothetical protein
MYVCDYYARRERRRWRARPLPLKVLTRAELYVQRVNEGSGSRKFRDYLNSKPLDKYLCYITKVPATKA